MALFRFEKLNSKIWGHPFEFHFYLFTRGNTFSGGGRHFKFRISAHTQRCAYTKRSLDINYFTRVHLFPIVSNCFQLFPIVSNCFQLFPIVSNCFQLFPIVSNCFQLQDLLPDVDAVIYVDIDALSILPLNEFWNYFELFDPTHIAGIVAENEVPGQSWYSEEKSIIPYVPPLGELHTQILGAYAKLALTPQMTSLAAYKK